MRRRMRHLLIALPLLLCVAAMAHAEVSVQIELPSVSIGINMPTYPTFVQVPDYPVYYAEQSNANYFFYDGLYWVFSGDNWYASSWYDGPWDLVGVDDVPLFVLRVPVRYYRQPPAYFGGWRSDQPPRWGEHWGHDWQTRRAGWDRWDHHSAPEPAPLPVYQRQYSGKSYPGTIDQQISIRSQNYRYEPREPVTRQHYAERPDRNKASSRDQVQQRDSSPHGEAQQSAPQEKGQQKKSARQDKHQQDGHAKHGQGHG